MSLTTGRTFSTIVHPFDSPAGNACAYESGLGNAKNSLVFIGGLGDGPNTVPYLRAIAKRLESRPELSYSVFEFRLRSSFLGFGFQRLADDVEDTSALVKYLRSIGKEKVVLIGHSTGCQVFKFFFSLCIILFIDLQSLLIRFRTADKARILWNIPPLHTRT